MSSSSNRLHSMWLRLQRLPAGRRMFSFAVGRMARYTGTIRPLVEELGPGHCRVVMADRRRVRNHLRSIHAVALVNLAEVTSGLAMVCGVPDDGRAILTGFSIEYVKKARGRLTATCDCEVPAATERAEYDIEAEIVDTAGDVVARARARWLVGPREASA